MKTSINSRVVAAISILLGASISRAFAADAARTIVLPFATTGAAADGKWIGSAVQHSLLADLPNASAPTGEAVNTDDPAVLARIGKSADAAFVVTGQVQTVDDQVRLVAQLFDRDGHVIGGAKASGGSRDLFRLEDQLSFDLRDLICTSLRSRHATSPMPSVASIGILKMAPLPALPVGTVPANYTNRNFREGAERNIYNTPFYEYDGFGFCGYGGGGFGFGGFGGFGFGSANVGFATGGTGQGAY